MTSAIIATAFYDSEAASPEDGFYLFKTRDSYINRLFRHLEPRDLESATVLTRWFLLSHPRQVSLHSWVVVCVHSRPSSLPQRGQVDVPEQRHQVGDKHPELPKRTQATVSEVLTALPRHPSPGTEPIRLLLYSLSLTLY